VWDGGVYGAAEAVAAEFGDTGAAAAGERAAVGARQPAAGEGAAVAGSGLGKRAARGSRGLGRVSGS
jgi:hypothetical protein